MTGYPSLPAARGAYPKPIAMSQVPDRHEQILLVQAELIRQVAKTCGNAERSKELDALLASAEPKHVPAKAWAKASSPLAS